MKDKVSDVAESSLQFASKILTPRRMLPAPTESLRTQDSEYVYERWVQQIFDPVLVARSWVSATKWGPLAKL